MHGDYNDLLEEDIDFNTKHEPDNSFWKVIAILLLLGLIFRFLCGCSSVQTFDYNRVLQVLMEYKDQIPYDDIKNALEGIK